MFQPLPTGGLEAKFDTQDWFGWATVAWEKLKHLIPHAMSPGQRAAEPSRNRPGSPFSAIGGPASMARR